MTSRLYLESQLIGGALFSPAHALDILDTLTEINFKEDEHRRIFATLTELSRDGDLSFPQITLRWLRDQSSSYILTQRLGEYTGAPILPLALRLLEMDMREKFVSLLQKMEQEKSRSEAFEHASAIKQTRDYLSHPAHDLFESIDRVGDYLRSYLSPDEMGPWEALEKAIPKLIDRIRNRSKTQTYLSQMLSLPASAESYSQKTCLTIISEITTSLLSRKEIPQHVVDNLYNLKNNLWARQTKSNPSPNF